MTREEAAALAEWIKDHDTRFEAKERDDHVLLTRPSDGTRHVEPVDCGPTIKMAWEKWRTEQEN